MSGALLSMQLDSIVVTYWERDANTANQFAFFVLAISDLDLVVLVSGNVTYLTAYLPTLLK